MAEPKLESIEVGRLRVGMFIVLEPGDGPAGFDAAGFVIRSEDELARIRAAGVTHVRHAPHRDEPAPLPSRDSGWGSLGVPVRDGGASKSSGDRAEEPSRSTAGGTHDANGPGCAAADGPPAPAAEPAADGGARATAGAARDEAERAAESARRRARLADQQASLDRCERQFSEASRQLRGVLQNAKSNPAQAREVALAQVQAMVGQVDGIEDVAIRLLSEQAGQETTLHAMNVSVLSILLGRALKFDAAQLAHLGLGALLHDIGKLELPDRLRWRDDHAPAVERRLFQEHAGHGVALAKKMGLPTDAIEVIAQHHEHADGSGYPAGLKGAQIRPLARVVALVNQYDNFCNPGNPAQALTPHDALALLFARHRDAFDSTVLAAFIRMMGVYPPGSVLQLHDERHAIVVAVNPDRPLKPKVLIHDPEVPPEEALVVDLEQRTDIGIQRAVKPLQLPRAVFDYLSPRKRMCYFFERSMAAPREARG